MKLYLSSYRMGDHFSELQEMAEPQARVAVISNALDYISIEKRLEYSLTHFDWCDFSIQMDSKQKSWICENTLARPTR